MLVVDALGAEDLLVSTISESGSVSDAAPAPRTFAVRVPTDDDLARAYLELSRLGASAQGAYRDWPYDLHGPEELVCLCSEFARYDPRMLGVLVEFFLGRYETFHPVKLRRAMRGMRFPQALCVMLDFAKDASHDHELALFARYVCEGVPRLPTRAHFVVDDVRPGTKLAEARSGRSLAADSRWGFVGVERPTVDTIRKTTVRRFDAETRHAILRRLVTREGDRGVTLAQYLDAVDGSISRQQAHADLVAAGLSSTGHGRGARWLAARHKKARERVR